MREVQFHPVREQVLHIDFYKVVPGKPIAVDVPVRLTGNSEGVKQGGKLMLNKRKLRIQGEMSKLPDEIVVDVTELGLGKTIFVGDLRSDDYTLLTPATTAVCAVKMTRAARGAAAAAQEE
jgi:large subunit ribosomal protein L25